MNTVKRTEHGQAIFLIAFGIISLLAFTALAIDGGRLYSDRRAAQDTADTAALTGALYIGQAPVGTIGSNTLVAAEKAGVARTVSNGFADTDPQITTSVIASEVTTFFGSYYLVTTTITSEIDPTFAQLVFRGPLVSTVIAVSKVIPQAAAGFGYAVYATSDGECNSLKITGTSNTNVTNSGIFVNSSMDTTPCHAVDISGASQGIVAGDIVAVGSINRNGSTTLTANAFVDGAVRPPTVIYPTPDCSGLDLNPAITGSGIDKIYHPGRYPSGISRFTNPNAIITFESGMYCITGGMDGLTILSGTIIGNGVMFYVEVGDISISGGGPGALVTLTAPNNGSAHDGTNNWDGMLFYMPESNDGLISISGNTSSYFEGTIYAPGAPHTAQNKCTVTGNGDIDTFNTQIICYSIELNGAGDLNINYDGSNHYVLPTRLDLLQ